MDDEHFTDESFDDDDTWDEDDWSDDDEPSDVVECPNCGAEIYEDAEQCPSCGDYVVHSSHPFSGKPAWYVLMALAGIVATIVLLSGLMG